MKKLFLLCFTAFSLQGYSQSWQANNTFTGYPLSDIYFTTPEIGFLAGDGLTIRRTTNGGESWTATPSPQQMTDLEFPNPVIGYACGQTGAFMKTIDGGQNWITITPWTTDHLTEMYFLSPDTGFILCYNPSTYVVVVWKTVNGGLAWNTTGSLGTNNTCHDIYFLNNTVGFVAGMGGSRIWSTYDGGTTWSMSNIGVGSGLMCIDFLNDTTGFTVGNDGNIFKTTDQGLSWVQQPSPTLQHLRTVQFTDPLNGWISGYGGTILRTNNGGLTWDAQVTPTTDQVTNMFMYNVFFGWAVTYIPFSGGQAWKYGDYYMSDSANVIHGNVYGDMNGNCVVDAGDIGQINWFVQAAPGPYYGVTDTAGNYSILVPPGTYSVTQIPPATAGVLVTPCSTPSYTATFPAYNGDTTGFDFQNSVSMCPYLSIDVSSDRRRRCRRNTTTVHYYNLGYAASASSQVIVDFPQYVLPVSSSLPWTMTSDSNYVFNVGNIAPQTYGMITIIDSVICWLDSIRGFTQCTEARITPANTCPPASAQWDGSDIETKAKCLLNGYLRFTILNNGLSMSDSAAYRIYMNNQLVRTANYKLNTGDSLDLVAPSNAQTFRIEADQRPFHPAKSQSNASVEGCTVDVSGNYVLGYIPQLPQDDENPETSIQCLIIVDAFDPNEKTVEPGGITAAHLVRPETTLDFCIHFQNTGSDTAFDIHLIDTLSPDLDIHTLQFGASSHPYSVSFLPGPLPTLRIDFNNILLPDSTTNEPGSNGFVNFSVKPDSLCPLNTMITNFADIYFDFNQAVRTDTAFVTLSNFQPTGNYTDTIISGWPLAVGPSSICLGDTASLFMLGDIDFWWSTAASPNDTVSVVAFLDTAITLPTYFIAHCASGVDTIFVDVVSCPLAVENFDEEKMLQLFPNPAADEVLFSVNNGSEAIADIRVYDQGGRLVLARKANAATVLVSTHTCEAGIYTAIVQTTQGNSLVCKLVIVK